MSSKFACRPGVQAFDLGAVVVQGLARLSVGPVFMFVLEAAVEQILTRLSAGLVLMCLSWELR